MTAPMSADDAPSPAGHDRAGPSIVIDGVTVRYGRHCALDAVDAALPGGRATALIGPNGSGKTTLLHVIAGLVEPQAGTVTPEFDVAYVLQHHGSRSWMPLTVDEVLRMGRYGRRGLLGRLRDDDRRSVDDAARRLAVDHLRRRQFGELSGGQRQRVLVAQALAQGSPVLLMDEPITGLDLESQQRILDVIDDETRSGTTVVLSTHDLDEARHCDHVLLLAGALVASGPPDEVLAPEVLRTAYESHALHAGHGHPTGVVLVDEHVHDHPHDV